jgi:hypothetical protein
MITDLNAPASAAEAGKERAQRRSTAAWTAGVTAFFAAGALAEGPTWPTAFGVTAFCAMVAVVCLRILKG